MEIALTLLLFLYGFEGLIKLLGQRWVWWLMALFALFYVVQVWV